jgi:DNA-binding NarL/FixJ family response regulator
MTSAMHKVQKALRPAAVRVALVALPLTAWGLSRLLAEVSPPFELTGIADSAIEAVPLLQDWQPDVLVLDLDGEAGAEAVGLLNLHLPSKVLVLVTSPLTDLHDSAVLAGARGVVEKREQPQTLLKAIEKVHAGEMWIDRSATGRIFMELARRKPQTQPDPETWRIDHLTPRERQLVVALASDAAAPGKVVAQRLHISEHTLRNHLTSVYGKLGVSNRVELYAFAHRHGLTRP